MRLCGRCQVRFESGSQANFAEQRPALAEGLESKTHAAGQAGRRGKMRTERMTRCWAWRISIG
jgi:hypothetical protein